MSCHITYVVHIKLNVKATFQINVYCLFCKHEKNNLAAHCAAGWARPICSQDCRGPWPPLGAGSWCSAVLQPTPSWVAGPQLGATRGPRARPDTDRVQGWAETGAGAGRLAQDPPPAPPPGAGCGTIIVWNSAQLQL